MRSATAFAPATVANVAVGFDILGFAIESVGDIATVSITSNPSVTIKEILDQPGTTCASALPLDSSRNAATVGLIKLHKDLAVDFGFEVVLRKGIALGSGMGGSAASAVASLVAANSLLDAPLSKERMFKYALLGEEAVTGTAHPDNVAPCLFGGMTLVLSADPVRYVSLPVPVDILAVVIHPQLRLDTRKARTILKPEVELKDHVTQSANLGGFIAGCFLNDLEMVRASLQDCLIEPQRTSLIPGLAEVKLAALQKDAIGASISGSGPSVFAWVNSPATASRVRRAMVDAFMDHGVTEVDSWISPINYQGAAIVQ